MKRLPVPRLQIKWEESKEEGDYGKEHTATYEMVLYEGEEALLDIRANDEEGSPSAGAVTVEMGQTKCSGGNTPYEYEGEKLTIPFRDGVHIKRDSIRLGNLPMYVIYGDKVEEIEQDLVEVDGKTVNKSFLEEKAQ